MISTPTSVGMYKAVLVLNNTGITLLQRHLYLEALSTFKDATDLMSCVRDDDRRQMGAEKAKIFLEQASVRMSKSTKIGGDDQPNIIKNCSVDVIYQGEYNHSKEILSTFPELFHGFVYLLTFDEECVDVLTDTAMLLHNFSVSIRLNVHQTRTLNYKTAMNNKMMEFAYRVECGTHNILNEYIATSAHEYGLDFPARKHEETIQLAVVVVKDLMLLSKATQHHDNEVTARKYSEQLNQLRLLLLLVEDSSLTSSLSKCIKAAQAA
jgi:hypothetical protein